MPSFVLSFSSQEKEREKSFKGSGPKENFGEILERNALAVSTHSSSFDDVCLMTADAKA